MNAHILIMDDNPAEMEPLRRYLEADGYAVTVVDNATDTKKSILAGEVDLALVDIDMAPKLEIEARKEEQLKRGEEPVVPEEGLGFEIAAWIRKHNGGVGVAILTHRNTEKDTLEGFGRGADDYITKTQTTREVTARVGAILDRRSPLPKNKATIKVPNKNNFFELNLQSRVLTKDNNEFQAQLTKSEFLILKTLVERAKKVVKREELYAIVKGGEMDDPGDRAVHTLIQKIRKKIGVVEENEDLIKTIHGVGYMLDSEVTLRR